MTDTYLVLHGLAIKKHADAAAVAAAVGLAEAEVQAVLADAVAKGRATCAGEAYSLTPVARVALDGAYSRLYAAQRNDEAFIAAYQRFEAINRDLKQLMTAWQTIEIDGESVLNDHTNKDYDDKLIDRLGSLHERAEAVFRQLAAGLPRLAIYAKKLEVALEKAEDGATEWVSGANIESYHTVWFELHEDLLRILGRTRQE